MVQICADASHNMAHTNVISVCNPYAGSLAISSLSLKFAFNGGSDDAVLDRNNGTVGKSCCATRGISQFPCSSYCRHLPRCWAQEILFCTTSVKGKKAWLSRVLLNRGRVKCRISLTDEMPWTLSVWMVPFHIWKFSSRGHRA